MPEDVRLKIYEESGRDFSAEVCAGAKWTDLDPAAIESFRKTWIEKRHNQQIGNVSHTMFMHLTSDQCEWLS